MRFNAVSTESKMVHHFSNETIIIQRSTFEKQTRLYVIYVYVGSLCKKKLYLPHWIGVVQFYIITEVVWI